MEEIEETRPRSQPQNRFQFGGQEIHTKVQMMTPRDVPTQYIDVTDAMRDHALGKQVTLNAIPADDVMLENVYASGGVES
jgi:hypothetical protein